MKNNSYIDFIVKKEINREDNDNIYCTGITEREFIKFAIKYLLGDNWCVADPLGYNQVIQMALEEILNNYSKKFRKEIKRFNKRKEHLEQ